MKKTREQGFSFIILLIIIFIGVAIGVVIYILSSRQREDNHQNGIGSNEILQTIKEKNSQPKPTEETKNQTMQVSLTPTSSSNAEAPSAKANFSQEGAFFAKDDGWTLLWDEPGRLAMNVKVKFNDQSICLLGGEKKDCALINMGPQSYGRVKLEGVRNGDEVTVIKLEEVKMPL